MKLIFIRRITLQLSIIIAIIISIVLIFFDHQNNLLNKIHSYLDNIVSPFYFITNKSKNILDIIVDFLIKKEQLICENQALKKEIIIKKSQILLLKYLKKENSRLRTLLKSSLIKDNNITMTQVLSKIHTPYHDQIIIDKGIHDGVYEGQTVINDKGIVGQVITVSQFNSRVLLICDVTHAIPIQILRNNIRVIAFGKGCENNLQLEPLPQNTDIHIGDIIVTSGLGDRFPEGYPVAIISSIINDIHHANIIIYAQPYVNLHTLKYLLLIWNNKKY